LPLAEYIAPLLTPAFFADGFCQEQLGFNARGLAGFVESWRRSPFAAFGLLTFELWGRLFIRAEPLPAVEEWLARFESGAQC
jgi:hypothetical protein